MPIMSRPSRPRHASTWQQRSVGCLSRFAAPVESRMRRTCRQSPAKPASDPHRPGLLSGVASFQRERRYRFSSSNIALCHEANSSRYSSTSEQTSMDPERSQSPVSPSTTTGPGARKMRNDVCSVSVADAKSAAEANAAAASLVDMASTDRQRLVGITPPQRTIRTVPFRFFESKAMPSMREPQEHPVVSTQTISSSPGLAFVTSKKCQLRLP